MDVLIGQRGVKFALQNILNRVDDEVYTLYRRINNAKFIHSFRECSFEELLIEILDNSLLTFEIVNVADVILN